MVSLRDPVRDTLAYLRFRAGHVLGIVAMGIFSVPDYERTARRYTFVFLLGAIALGLLLASPLGTGPGTSDAKVNLFGFQPVEVIRLLIVFLPGGLFRRTLGRPARSPPKSRTACRRPRSVSSAEARLPDPGRRRRGASLLLFFFPERPWAGAGHRLPVSHPLQPGARTACSRRSADWR